MFKERDILTVSDANKLAKKILENGSPEVICIEGEISNITYHSSGHLYFTVKDDKSNLKAVAFSFRNKNIDESLTHGDLVRLFGRLTIYEGTGQFQFLCGYIEKKREHGDLYKKFLELKERLTLKGYFEESIKKRIIPSRKIGVVTSEKGAVIRDIVSTARSRFEGVDITLFSAQVQGEGADKEIIEGIKFFNESDIDLIIIGRGGGSFEDLNAFNSEELAEEIYRSKKPIISAVGHETDFVISDFVSDARAATPTHAAVLAVIDKKHLMESFLSKGNLIADKIRAISDRNRENLFNKEDLLTNVFENSLFSYKNELEKREQSYLFKNFMDNIDSRSLHTSRLKEKLDNIILHRLESSKLLLSPKIDILKGLSPIEILSRGYSLTTFEGKRISSSRDLSISDIITTKFAKGFVKSEIIDIED